MIDCYKDNNGYWRVDHKDLHPLIGSFLEQDVQGSINHCQSLLAALGEVRGGGLPEWSETGNAHTVTIYPDHVTIENEWDEETCIICFNVNVFSECVSKWLNCIGK